MKILYLGWGEHVHVTRWAEQFASRGESVSVLSLTTKSEYKSPVRQFLHRFADKRIALQHLWVKLILLWVRPDIIHVQWLHFLTLVPPGWTGKLVVTGWGSDLYLDHQFEPTVQKAFDTNMKRVDWFTVDSADQRKVLIEKFGVPEDRVSVVQWGVDRKTFFEGSPAIGRENAIYSCRNLAPIYNQDVLVKAFAKVRKAIPDATLIIKTHRAEEPPYSLVMGLIDELGLKDAVEILPSLPYEELPSLYQRAKVTVSIPDTDGTPMTVLEAMACGSIPVFSDVPSLREWIVDGDNGFLSGSRDIAALAEKMIHALTLDAAEMNRISESNQVLITEKADHDAHMDAVHDRYRALLGGE